MNAVSRRRFLIDLGFAGGALALVAGWAAYGRGKPPKSVPAVPANPPEPVPPDPGRQAAGEFVAPPPRNQVYPSKGDYQVAPRGQQTHPAGSISPVQAPERQSRDRP